MLPDPSENVFRICCASVKIEAVSAPVTQNKNEDIWNFDGFLTLIEEKLI